GGRVCDRRGLQHLSLAPHWPMVRSDRARPAGAERLLPGAQRPHRRMVLPRIPAWQPGSLVDRPTARAARGHRGLRRLPLPRSLGLAPGGRGHGGWPDAGSDLSLAAGAFVATCPGPCPRRDHLRISQPRALPYLSVASPHPSVPGKRGRARLGLALFGLAQPLPLLVAPVVACVNPAKRARSAARDQRFRLRPVHVVLDALEHFAVGDPGGGEEDVVATNKVVDAEHLVEVRAGGLRLLFLLGIAGVELALDLAAEAFQRGSG